MEKFSEALRWRRRREVTGEERGLTFDRCFFFYFFIFLFFIFYF